ncbi:MAG: flagellar hook-basal body protein [Eubacteriales bacterium]|jgi:flagellar basal-body rod protein FlgG
MNKIFRTGVTGMMAYQNKLNTTANNLANINTPGYKPEHTRFENLLYSPMDVNTQEEVLSGNGVKQSGSVLKLDQGSLVSTGNPLDFAIAGEGFFAVDKEGVTEYTRNGAFRVDLQGYYARIVTNDGYDVLDRNGYPVTLDIRSDSGQPDYESLKDKIGIYSFENPYGLERTVNGRFIATVESGQAFLSDYQGVENEDVLYSGFLEASSVSLGDEMVDVIKSQRAFQMSARIVQTADELEEIVNNLR